MPNSGTCRDRRILPVQRRDRRRGMHHPLGVAHLAAGSPGGVHPRHRRRSPERSRRTVGHVGSRRRRRHPGDAAPGNRTRQRGPQQPLQPEAPLRRHRLLSPRQHARPRRRSTRRSAPPSARPSPRPTRSAVRPPATECFARPRSGSTRRPTMPSGRERWSRCACSSRSACWNEPGQWTHPCCPGWRDPPSHDYDYAVPIAHVRLRYQPPGHPADVEGFDTVDACSVAALVAGSRVIIALDPAIPRSPSLSGATRSY